MTNKKKSSDNKENLFNNNVENSSNFAQGKNGAEVPKALKKEGSKSSEKTQFNDSMGMSSNSTKKTQKSSSENSDLNGSTVLSQLFNLANDSLKLLSSTNYNKPQSKTPSNSNKNFGKENPASAATNNKQEIVSVTYEEIGLFPRSFSRVLDRFLKQVFSDVENLVIQEYRFYRYLFLTTVRCLFILFFVPFLVNFFAKNYLIHPLTEYFWNTKQTEIFLNSYQQKHAFAELKEFEEKLYFESLIHTHTQPVLKYNSIVAQPTVKNTLESGLNSAKTKENSALTGLTLGNTVSNSTVQPQLKVGSGVTLTNTYQDQQNLDKKESYSDSKDTQSLILAGDLNTQLLNNSTNLTQNQQLFGPTNSNNLIDPVSIENSESLNAYSTANSLEGIRERNVLAPLSASGKNSVISVSEAQKQKLQEKIVEIATRYNEQSIEAITNFFADLLSLITLFYLLFALEIQINITKSFLLEVFFGLDDTKKSLFILLVTDLLVGYHSSNIWELFFSFIFTHYGLPESQTGIFLLVATLPVLLDVLFKYLIFRHLNRSSPATVATYHAMIE